MQPIGDLVSHPLGHPAVDDHRQLEGGDIDGVCARPKGFGFGLGVGNVGEGEKEG